MTQHVDENSTPNPEPAKRRRRALLIGRQRPKMLPLSFAQERLWFLDQTGLVAGVYNMADALRLTGDLNVGALERSIRDLRARHESLRTRFESVDGTPAQVIDPPGAYSLEFQDLSQLEEQEKTLRVTQLAAESANRPFDLMKGPLFRTLLLRLSAQEHVLLTTLHHIVSDGWSIGVFDRELGLLYRAHCLGGEADLPLLAVQPADHAIWQRNWLQGMQLEEQLSYWRSQLDGLSTLELPTDHPRPLLPSFRGGVVEFDIPAELSRRLRALSRAQGATLYMLLLAAFQVLLARYSGQDDVAVGSPVAGRTEVELDSVIGFFVNTLVVRTNTSGNPSFRQLLERVKGTTLDALAHQELPFARIVQELRPERHLARQPLFQVMLGLHNFPKEPLELAGLTWTPLEIEHTTAQFDLNLQVSEEPQEHLRAHFEYATQLFDRPTIERMAGHLLRVLQAVVEDPDCAIGRLRLLPEDEHEQVVRLWNNRQARYPDALCVHDLVAAQVERSPGAQAVVFQDSALTYSELNGRANQLARYLRSLGVGPGSVVGICMERSLEMVLSLLAVLKAGGAYLPLDPSYPAERLRYMLEDATPRVVLTQKTLRNRLTAVDAHLIELDEHGDAAEEILAFDNTYLSPEEFGASAEQLVFVIYTSGSTGQPKGTAMPHSAMVNLLEWHRSEFGSAAGVRILQFAALSFDVSFLEIFSTLSTGGTLVLLDEWVRRDRRALTDFMRSQHIGRLFIPPLMLQSVAEHCVSTGELPEALRDVIAAGEQLLITAELRTLFSRLHECRLHNCYGPTETHVVTAQTLPEDARIWPDLPLIGQPIPNVQIYLLDEERQPVPTGVRGEIYIGGAAVARGYVGRPELTAQRFVPDPFSTDSHARLYRTGDLGRWRPNGAIQFLGRNDDQVKIRGYRIEPAEIEAHLARHPQVREAAVVARVVAEDEKALVAYVTACGDSHLLPADLRGYLVALLPEYMVPSTFVVLDSMPLTPSGKLDRRALPTPGMSAYASRQHEVPEGHVEQTLAQLWERLLRVKGVGREDNFFELGGHSMLIVQLVDQVYETLGVRPPVISVYRHPTIRQLATEIESLRRVSGTSVDPDLPRYEEGII